MEDHGKDKAEDKEGERRWNGRVIVVLGDQYTEVEEKYADLRSVWLGEENARLFRTQVDMTQQIISLPCGGWRQECCTRLTELVA